MLRIDGERKRQGRLRLRMRIGGGRTYISRRTCAPIHAIGKDGGSQETVPPIPMAHTVCLDYMLIQRHLSELITQKKSNNFDSKNAL